MQSFKFRKFFVLFLLAAGLALVSGCGEPEAIKPARTSTRPQTVATTPVVPPNPANTPLQPGIALDPNLASVTGTPNSEEMKGLIALQSRIPYAVMVPTELPGGYKLDVELIGFSPPTTRDPLGYYSFRFSDPGNTSRVMTFNQSQANANELSGYYLTEETINDVDYQVYWHRSLEYLPNSGAVRTVRIEEPETFVVTWKGQFTNAAGQPQEVYYSLSTGSYTGHGWGDIRAVLESLRPLASVGG